METDIYIPENYDPEKIDFSKIDLEKINARTISEKSDCIDCFNRIGGVCLAFPLGIPNKYFYGTNKHRVPDGREVDGIVYEFNSDLMEL